MKDKNRTIENSLIRYCRGLCSNDEASWVRSELQKSSGLQSKFDNLKKVIQLEEDIDEYKSYDVASAYQQTRNIIIGNYDKLRIGRYSRWNVAAMLLPFFLLTVVLAYLYISEVNKPVLMAEISTAPGIIGRYELPDKSVVWLNAGSKLRFPTTFDKKEREVELWGEGFFEVQSDKDRPFYVKTEDGSKVYAYGTRFNVNSYCDNDFIETVLEEGKVNIIDPTGETSAVLKPGQSAYYCKIGEKMTVASATLYEKLAWKEGKMVFRAATLEDIFKKLSRHYNVDIDLIRETDKVYKYRATFKDETVFQILDYLKKSAPLDWSFKESEQKVDSTFSKRSIRVILKKEPG